MSENEWRATQGVTCDRCDGLGVVAPMCEVPHCPNEAVYEGWARKIEPFTRQRMGTRLFRTCPEHKRVLIGFQTEEPA